jgi:deoxyribodipyrimidine photo-lyase
MIDPRRVCSLNAHTYRPGPVIYWMSRDQRVNDNWALLYAQEVALGLRQPLAVVFCLVPDYLGASDRHYRFMLAGMKETAAALKKLNIPFFLFRGTAQETLAPFIRECHAGAVITDFNPLRPNRKWKEDLLNVCPVRIAEVDAHNIVPCRVVSSKQEFGAYTIRPKISRLLRDFLMEFPVMEVHPFPWEYSTTTSPPGPLSVSERGFGGRGNITLQPGEKAAATALSAFLEHGLDRYEEQRNDPTLPGQSGLSPYLHFGQLSAQRVAIEVIKNHRENHSAAAFLEELIVRRELSDNFCFNNPHYDSVEGFPAWSRKTLDEHRSDRRENLYTVSQFEEAATHDDLWNAAQREMAFTGKMHGFMRMYWAKKILEWTTSPEEAMAVAIYLNDRYSLDGRDPNGYAGIAWAIGGVHDRAWAERPVFGKIRYMNYNGCKRKFNVGKYIR